MPISHKSPPPNSPKNLPFQILIVKASPITAERLIHSLAEAGFAAQHRVVHSLSDMSAALAENSFGLILADWRLPDSNGIGPYEIYRQANSTAPLIVCPDEPNDQEAEEALRSGAYDYITRDRLHLIGPLVERALRDSEARHQAGSTRRELDRIYGELERRIEQRTSAIEALNEQLREEIRERRRTEEQLHLAIAGSEGAVWNISFDENDPWHIPEHIIIPARQKQMLGFADDEFPNSFSAWESRIHPYDLPIVRNDIQCLVDGAIDFSNIECRMQHRDGTYRWLQLRGSLLRDRAGRPVEWNLVVWDITTRKTVEQSLLEQKDQLLLAIEGSEGMIWSVEADSTDPQGWSDAFHIDPRMKQFLGFAPEEFPDSRRAWDIRIPENYRRQAHRAMAAHAVGDEERFMVEYPIQHRDGHYVWASMRGRLLRDPQGMPLRMMGMMWDITDRRQYEQQLAESEARFRMLVEASPDGIAIHQDERIQFVNKAFVDLMGAESASQLIGLPIWQLIRPDFHDVVKERITTVQIGMALPPLEEVWTTLHSKEVSVEVTGSALTWRGRPAYQAILRDISYRRQAEIAIRDSQQKLERAAAMTRLGHWESDPEGQEIWVSPEMCEILGIEPCETISRDLYMKAVHPDDRALVKRTILAALRDGHPYEVEFRLVRPDGEERVVHARGEVSRREAGRPEKSFGAVQDVTQQRLQERALRESEERLGLAIEGTGLATWDVNLTTGETVWSEGFYGMLGYSSAMTLPSYEKWAKALHPDDRERVLRTIQDAKDNRNTYTIEYRIIQYGSGDIRWQQATGRFLYGQKNEATRFLGVVLDTTQRKRVEEALRQNEERLRATFENAGVGIVEVDTAADRIIAANQRLSEILGRPREQLLGMTVSELTHPDDRRHTAELNDLLHTGQSSQVDYEKRYLKGDGSPVWVHVTVSAVRDGHGHWVRSIATIEDIAERKDVEEALHRNQSLMAEAEHLSHTGAWEWNLLNNRWTFSDEWLAIHGVKAQTLNASELLAIAHPDDRAAIEQAFEDVRTGTKAYDIEHRIVRRDTGEIRVIRAAGRYVRDESGNLVRVYGFAQDITEQKRAEKALTDAEQRYASLFSASITGLAHLKIVTDEQGAPIDYIVTAVNEAYEKILGVKRADIEGKRITEVFPTIQNSEYDFIGEYGRVGLEGGELQFETLFEPTGQWLSVYAYSPRPGETTAIFTDITDRKRAEEAVRESEERFATAFQASPDGLVISEIETGIMVEVNDAWVNQWGYSREETIGRRSAEIGILDKLADREYLVHELRTQGHVRRLELPFRRKSGELRYAELSTEVLHLSGKRLMLTIVHDVTERKLAEQQLAASTERYRRLVDTSPHGIFVHVDGIITYANPAITQLLGYNDSGELVGRRWFDIVAPESNERADRLRPLYDRTATSLPLIDLLLLRVDGNVQEVEVAASSFELDGKLAIQEIIHDISDLRRLTAALTDAQERVRMTVAASNIALWQADQSLRYIWVYNPQTHDSAEAVIGKSDRDLLPHADDAERMSALKRRCMETGQSLRQELMLHKPDGSPVWFELSLEPWRDETGGIVGVNGASINISERKKAAEELVLAHDKLRRFVDANIVGIVIGDSDGSLAEANDYFLNLVGYTREELRKGELKWSAITPDEYIPADQAALEELMATGVCAPYEKEYIRRDGTRVPVFIADALLPGPENQIVGFVLDITDRKQFERELQKAHNELEVRVFERTGELIEANKLLVREVEERSQAEQKLRHATEQLEHEREVLERKNIALKEILGQIDSEKAALKSQLSTNVEQVVMPTLRRLKEAPRNTVGRLLEVLEQDLQTITKPFVDTLKTGFDKLSPREIEVCRLIKNGLSTKEMAEVLNLSPMTIQKHREIIRKKLGLTGGDTNLRSFLQNLTEIGPD